MVYLFKKLKVIYLICHSFVSIALISVTIYFVSSENTFNNPLPVILLLLAMIIEVFGFEFIANSKHTKLCAILNNDCEPLQFLYEYFPLIDRAKSNLTKYFLMINLASGYINIGDFEQAQSVLGDINVNDLNKPYRIHYHNVWTTLFINQGKISDAEYSLNFTKELLAKHKINKAYLMQHQNSVKLLEAELNILKNNLNGVENTLLEYFYTSKLPLHKVNAKYALAQLYIKQNNTEKAVDAMKYTAENGNTLYIAQQARDFLASEKQ